MTVPVETVETDGTLGRAGPAQASPGKSRGQRGFTASSGIRSTSPALLAIPPQVALIEMLELSFIGQAPVFLWYLCEFYVSYSYGHGVNEVGGILSFLLEEGQISWLALRKGCSMAAVGLWPHPGEAATR